MSAQDTPIPLASRIVVAIPTLNEADHIETTIRTLIGDDPRMREVRIVCADGGSTDATRAIVERLRDEFVNVSVIDNPQRLAGAGVNAVARAFAGRADVLVRCDAHAGYPRGFVFGVSEALLRRDAVSIVVAMDSRGLTCFQKANAWAVDLPIGSGGAAHRGGRRSGYVDHGHHAAFRLEVFNRLAGYDASFATNEDAELDVRLARAGGRIYLDTDWRIDYFPRATLAAVWRQYRAYGRGRARNLRKHAQRPKLRQAIPAVNLLALAGALAIAPLLPWALAAPALYVGALASASVFVALREKSLCGLGAGLALGAMHTAWAFGFLGETLTGTAEPAFEDAAAHLEGQ
jgi:succinoglycan biosynthesis protein ExoA